MIASRSASCHRSSAMISSRGSTLTPHLMPEQPTPKKNVSAFPARERSPHGIHRRATSSRNALATARAPDGRQLHHAPDSLPDAGGGANASQARCCESSRHDAPASSPTTRLRACPYLPCAQHTLDRQPSQTMPLDCDILQLPALHASRSGLWGRERIRLESEYDLWQDRWPGLAIFAFLGSDTFGTKWYPLGLMGLRMALFAPRVWWLRRLLQVRWR